VVWGWLRWAVHSERRRRRTAGVGNDAPAKIGERLGAGELEQRLEKLVRWLARAMGGRQWLPTTSRSRRSGRREGQQWSSRLEFGNWQKNQGNGM
jgi:hypothetical protein